MGVVSIYFSMFCFKMIRGHLLTMIL